MNDIQAEIKTIKKLSGSKEIIAICDVLLAIALKIDKDGKQILGFSSTKETQ